jgi:hypothetical protein
MARTALAWTLGLLLLSLAGLLVGCESLAELFGPFHGVPAGG